MQGDHFRLNLFDILIHAERRHAVVLEVGEGLGRHGVDRMRADEVVHIDEIGIVGVLGAGAGPKWALQLCAGRAQRLPTCAHKDLLEVAIGELGVAYGDLALEGEDVLGLVWIALGEFGQATVHGGIDAADKEAGD